MVMELFASGYGKKEKVEEEPDERTDEISEDLEAFVNIDKDGPESNVFINNDKINSKPKKVIAVDIDGTMVRHAGGQEDVHDENENIFRAHLNSDNAVAGMISRRKEKGIWDFSDEVDAKPDFFCSTNFQPTKDKCLNELKKRYPDADQHVYIGDSQHDEFAARQADYTFKQAAKKNKKI